MDAVQKSGKIINEDPRLLESLWKTSSEKKLGHSDLKNDLLTSTTSEGPQRGELLHKQVWKEQVNAAYSSN